MWTVLSLMALQVGGLGLTPDRRSTYGKPPTPRPNVSRHKCDPLYVKHPYGAMLIEVVWLYLSLIFNIALLTLSNMVLNST